MFSKVASVMIPISASGKYDRQRLWRNPLPYILPNTAACGVLIAIALMMPMPQVPADLLMAAAFVSGCMAVSAALVTVLRTLGMDVGSADRWADRHHL